MSTRAKFLVALVYGLVLFAFAAVKGTALLLAIPLLVYLAFGLWYAPGKPTLRIERETAAETAREGDLLPVTLTIYNEGGDIAALQIAERLPANAVIESGETETVIKLPSGEKSALAYTLDAQRGVMDFSEATVTVWGRLGLFSWTGDWPLTTQLTIMPRYESIRSLSARPARTMGFSGPLGSRQSGSGSDFFGVREYQLGDPLRRVNWRAAARHHEKLFTTEFEQERIANIGLILDMRLENVLRVAGDSLLDHGVRATAALAESLLQDGHRVGLLLYGFGLDGVLSGYGKTQRERILQKLAQARPITSHVFRSLKYLPTRVFPAGAQLIFISPLNKGDEEVLFRLRANGYSVLAVSPNPVEFEAGLLPDDPLQPLAIRLARAERQIFLRRLRQGGVVTVDWPVERPLNELIHTALRQMPPGERMGQRL